MGAADHRVQLLRLLVGSLVEGLARRRIEDGEVVTAGYGAGAAQLRFHMRRSARGRGGRVLPGVPVHLRPESGHQPGADPPGVAVAPSQTAPRTPTMSVPMRVSVARSAVLTLPARAASRPAPWASRTNSAHASGDTWSNSRVPSLIAVSSMAASEPERRAMSGSASGLTQPIRWASA